MSLRCAALVLLLLGGCPKPTAPSKPAPPAPPTAEIAREGVVECFASTVTGSCELSAVYATRDAVYFLNDKNLRDSAPLLRTDRALSPALTPLPEPTRDGARKFEMATVTPDGGWVIAGTAFDRVDPAGPGMDAYNELLYWPSTDPARVKVAAASERGGVVSSVALRSLFRAALKSDAFPEGPPYFKIEGLAALPDGRLLFGVRELGSAYTNMSRQIAILSLSYRWEGDELRLGEAASVVWRFVPPAEGGREAGLGLSSLEYDAKRGLLWMVTSYEGPAEAPGLNASVWSLSLRDLETGAPPTPLRGPGGAPLLLPYKAEGVTVLDDESLLLIHDQDTVIGPGRAPNQAPYTLLRLR